MNLLYSYFLCTLYFSHLTYTHQEERGFTVTCGIDGCEQKYSVVQSLSRHIRRNHNVNIDVDIHHDRLNDGDDNVDNFQDDRGNADQEENVHYDYARNIALFILKLREENKVPKNACSKVVHEIHELFSAKSRHSGIHW